MLSSVPKLHALKLDGLNRDLQRWFHHFEVGISKYTNYVFNIATNSFANYEGVAYFIILNGVFVLQYRLTTGREKRIINQSSISVDSDRSPVSGKRIHNHIRESMFCSDKFDSDSHSEVSSSYDDQIDNWLTDSDLSPTGSRSITPNSFGSNSYESPLTVGVESVERGVLLLEETYTIECNMIITSNALFESPTKMHIIDNSLNSTSNLSIKHVNKWTIRKRLSEFIEFIEIISKEFPKIPFEFPKNIDLYETNDYIEFKRLALNEYINSLSNNEEFMRKVSLFIKLAIFLDPPYGTRFFALAK